MKAVALVLGAGQGLRLEAGAPKAYVRLAGRSLLERSASALGRAHGVDALLPVVPAEAQRLVEELERAWCGPARLLSAVQGGATRQDSLANGLFALRRAGYAPEWVLVHDAARALVEPADAERVLAAARISGAAIPVLPLADTVKEVAGEIVVRTLDRSRLVQVQTPEAFRRVILEEGLEKAEREGFQGTDCASLVERLGVRVHTCAGRPENFKLTYPADLARARALLGEAADP